MSCITVSKTWRGSAPSRVEAVSPVLPAATLQRRATKKARATPQLVDTVREVVQAFEFEYAQVRAESVELKAVLDGRRTQLSDLRRHLERESSENGTLEAMVQHRSTKNNRGDARLQELENDFTRILKDDQAVASRAATLESDLSVFTVEGRRAREKASLAASQLDTVESFLEIKERALAQGIQESESLNAAVQEGRRKVEKQQSLLRYKQDKTSKAMLLAKETAEEAETLKCEVVGIREEFKRKENESEEISLLVRSTKLEAAESKKIIGEEKSARTQELRTAQDRLVDLNQQVEAKEKADLELDERIKGAQLAIATESEIQNARRSEIEAIKKTRKEAVETEIHQLSTQLQAMDVKAKQGEEAAGRAYDSIREANTEFSNLMAAMSAAFREYDQAVTANRELERGAAEADSALCTLRERIHRNLSNLRQTRDNIVSSNAEDQAAAKSDCQRAEELAGVLRDTQKSANEATSEFNYRKEMIAACEQRLEEGRARKILEEEAREKTRQVATEAENVAQEAVVAVRTRLKHCQTEVIEISRRTSEWIPLPAALSDDDLKRIEEKAKAAVTIMRAEDDEVHKTRRQSLKDTLTTIREGGAARLKAEKDAAVARLAVLQGKTVEVSRCLAELQVRSEAAQRTEAMLTTEISHREAEKRRDAEARAAAVSSAAAASAAAATAEATIARTSAAQVPVTKAAAAKAFLQMFTTPEACLTRRSSRGHQPDVRTLPGSSINTPGSESAVINGSSSNFATPDARLTNLSYGLHPSTNAPPLARDPTDAPGYGIDSPDSEPRKYNGREVSNVIDPPPHQGNSDRRPVDNAKRSKNPSRSSFEVPPTRRQQASESTAEDTRQPKARKSTKNASLGRKHSSSGSGRGRSKKKEKLAVRVSSKSPRGSYGTDRNRSDGDGTCRGRQRSDKPRKETSKPKSRSPRTLPISPRPTNKEYDLWTDNRLVGDSDFSFF